MLQPERVLARCGPRRRSRSRGGSSPCPRASRRRAGCSPSNRSVGDERPDREVAQRRGTPPPPDDLREQVEAQDRRDRPHLELDHRRIGRQEPRQRPSGERETARRPPEQRERRQAARTPRPDARSSSSHRHRPASPGRTPGRPEPRASARSRGRAPGRPGARPSGPRAAPTSPASPSSRPASRRIPRRFNGWSGSRRTALATA